MTILNKMQSSYNSKDIAENLMLKMFVENYVDLLENLPVHLSRKISNIHEINVHRFRLMNNLRQYRESYIECDSNDEKIKLINKMMEALIQMQQFTDSTNELTQTLYDDVDLKTRVLDSQWRMFSNQTLNPSSYSNQNSYSGNTTNTLASNQNGNFKEPTEKKQKEKDKDREKHDSKQDTSTIKEEKEDKESNTGTKKHKEVQKAEKSDKQNHSKRARRVSKKDFQQDSKDGSSEDRSSTPVTTTERSNGKRGTKRSKNSKTDIKARRGSTNPDSGSETYNQAESDEPTYCICEQISFGEMVCCDNTKCKIQWFHFVCVSLTSIPKGRWYCPNCRGDRSNVQKK